MVNDAHEAFVVSSTGAPSWEICAFACAPFAALLGQSAVATRLQLATGWSTAGQTALDLATLVPPVMGPVLFGPWALLPVYSLCLVPVALLRCEATSSERLDHLNRSHPAALTSLRAVVMLQTMFCILAVDFPVFPRRFAKTRTWGHSLMDLGVGAAILTGALVRRRAAKGAAAFLDRLKRVGRRHAPLVAIGVGRLALVKASDYHEVASEYGTHWNFFFTLAAVAAVAELATPADPRVTALCAALLLLLHQAALSHGLAHWVEHAQRRGLVSANKEGLCSLPGYLAIWWLGDAIGAIFRPRASCHGWWCVLAGLASLAAALWAGKRSQRLARIPVVARLSEARLPSRAAAHVADAHLQRASRRLCNLAYVLWVVSQVLVAACICLATSLTWPHPTPPLLRALNRHLLTAFLLANLLTGAINMSLPTKHAGSELALGVLCTYMATLCTAVIILESFQRLPAGSDASRRVQ